MPIARYISVFICVFSTKMACAEQVTAAVASNFAPAMRAIVTDFEQHSVHRVTLAFGSSGRFYAQIINGAPYDVFLSADQSTGKALQQQGLAVPGSQFTYAVGALVLWSASAGEIGDGGAVLMQLQFRRLAIANPRVAPYGVAALDVLRHLGIKEKAKGRLVQGESVAQAYQFVATGNAELGLVALSQVMKDGAASAGSAWRVPAHMHRAIKQDAVLLRKGESNKAAHELLQFMRSARAREIMNAFGYAADGTE